jgi:hypothetical protein
MCQSIDAAGGRDPLAAASAATTVSAMGGKRTFGKEARSRRGAALRLAITSGVPDRLTGGVF